MSSQPVRTDGMRARTLALYALTVLENPEVCAVCVWWWWLYPFLSLLWFEFLDKTYLLRSVNHFVLSVILYFTLPIFVLFFHFILCKSMFSIFCSLSRLVLLSIPPHHLSVHPTPNISSLFSSNYFFHIFLPHLLPHPHVFCTTLQHFIPL